MTNLAEQNISSITLLANKCEQFVSAWFGSGARLNAAAGSITKRPFSYLLRFPVQNEDGLSTAVYLRIARHSQNCSLEQAVQPNPAAAEKTQKYFDNATTIANTFAGTEFAYVRPLALWLQFNAVVTEELPYQTLRQLFNKPALWLGSAKKSDQFSQHLAQAGKWLSWYHQRVGQPQQRRSTSQEMADLIAQELTQLEPFLKNNSSFARLASQLEDLGRVVSQKSILWGQPHGDFHYANILVSPNGRLAVIDANASAKSRPVYTDLAKLIVDPLTLPQQWLTQALFLSQKRAMHLSEAVLKGYFGAEKPDKTVMKFYLLLAVIQKWIYIEKKSQRQLKSIPPVNFLLYIGRKRYFLSLCQKIATL